MGYGGLGSRNGLLNDSMYSEAGGDGRAFWPIARDTILAAHMALRYLPTSHGVPFWALSGIGGGESGVGGEQPPGGLGGGRVCDCDSFAGRGGLRRKVFTARSPSPNFGVEITPFHRVGRWILWTGTL